MKKIPMLEKFAVQSLVEHDGELIFSKEKFAELIVQECAKSIEHINVQGGGNLGDFIKKRFGVEE